MIKMINGSVEIEGNGQEILDDMVRVVANIHHLMIMNGMSELGSKSMILSGIESVLNEYDSKTFENAIFKSSKGGINGRN